MKLSQLKTIDINAKEFKDDPYYEIWGTDYSTISEAKKAIDNGELPL